MSEQLENITLFACMVTMLGYAVGLGFHIRELFRDRKRLKQLEKKLNDAENDLKSME